MASRQLRTFVFVPACLAPAAAAAQLPRTFSSFEDRLISYELQEQDYGTWDAEIVWRDDAGRFVRSRGREVNVPGCDGRCVKTRIAGGLRRRDGLATAGAHHRRADVG